MQEGEIYTKSCGNDKKRGNHMEVTEKVKVGMVKKVSSIVDKNNTAWQ